MVLPLSCVDPGPVQRCGGGIAVIEVSAGHGHRHAGTGVTGDAPTAPTDRDPFASSQQLAAAPQDAARPKPRIDPRSLRTIVDRGVAAYASAGTDADRAKAASEIQIAASAGFPSARVLLARNYPKSAAIRSVVPAKDVVRYALALLMDPASENDDTKQIFLGLGQHFDFVRAAGFVRSTNSRFHARGLASAT